MLGNDAAPLRRAIESNRRSLFARRDAGLLVSHTRKEHRPDLADLLPARKVRRRSTTTIGDMGAMGRILARGEPGHDIIQPVATDMTAEARVSAAVREANDHGYDRSIVEDRCASHFPEFHDVALRMVTAQSGTIGRAADLAEATAALVPPPALEGAA